MPTIPKKVCVICGEKFDPAEYYFHLQEESTQAIIRMEEKLEAICETLSTCVMLFGDETEEENNEKNVVTIDEPREIDEEFIAGSVIDPIPAEKIEEQKKIADVDNNNMNDLLDLLSDLGKEKQK